jgi:hypothetical protein
MRFDNADDDFAAVRLFLPRGLQHGVGLAYARRHPEENLQFAAGGLRLFALHARENRVWIRPFGLAHATILRCCRNTCTSEAMGKADEDVEIVGAVR